MATSVWSRSRHAARIAFAIGPLADKGATVSHDGAAERPGSWSGPRYLAVLEQMPELIEHTERFEPYWRRADAAYGASLEDLRCGLVHIEEVPEVDLAVVTREGGSVIPNDPDVTGPLAVALDPVAITQFHSTLADTRLRRRALRALPPL